MISEEVKQVIKKDLEGCYPPYIIEQEKDWRLNKVYVAVPKQKGLCLGPVPLYFEKDGEISVIESQTSTYDEWYKDWWDEYTKSEEYKKMK